MTPTGPGRTLLRGVAGFNVKEDPRHERRTISLDELRRLIEAAEAGEPFKSMTGPMRALCYRLAVASGLRYSEIGSITPESFDWTKPATVTIRAAYAKNGQTGTLPMPADLAADLAAYVATVERSGRRSSPCPTTKARRWSGGTWKPPASPTGTPRDCFRLPFAPLRAGDPGRRRGGFSPGRSADDAAFQARDDRPLHQAASGRHGERGHDAPEPQARGRASPKR